MPQRPRNLSVVKLSNVIKTQNKPQNYIYGNAHAECD